MNKDVDRLRERRERMEAQAQAIREQEIRICTDQRLSRDAQYKSLEKAAKAARRTLQLNRLGQAQKHRSIRAMKAKIVDTERAIKPLLDLEPSLVADRDTAMRDMKEYRRRVADDIALNLS